MATNLYRHFDADGRLLYVGISKNALGRLGAHKSVSCWFSQIASVTVEHFSRRQDAEKAERRAIRNEQPMFNKVRYLRKKQKRRKSTPVIRPSDSEYRPQFGPGGDASVLCGVYVRKVQSEYAASPPERKRQMLADLGWHGPILERIA